MPNLPPTSRCRPAGRRSAGCRPATTTPASRRAVVRLRQLVLQAVGRASEPARPAARARRQRARQLLVPRPVPGREGVLRLHPHLRPGDARDSRSAARSRSASRRPQIAGVRPAGPGRRPAPRRSTSSATPKARSRASTARRSAGTPGRSARWSRWRRRRTGRRSPGWSASATTSACGPVVDRVLRQFGCPACDELIVGGSAVQQLTAGPIAQPGVKYTVIASPLRRAGDAARDVVHPRAGRDEQVRPGHLPARPGRPRRAGLRPDRRAAGRERARPGARQSSRVRLRTAALKTSGGAVELLQRRVDEQCGPAVPRRSTRPVRRSGDRRPRSVRTASSPAQKTQYCAILADRLDRRCLLSHRQAHLRGNSSLSGCHRR